MNTFVRIGKGALPFVLLFLLTGPSVSAGDLSVNGALAVDRGQTLERRIEAIFALVASADESASTILLKILNDASEENRIRTGAVLGLAQLGKPRAEIIRSFESVYDEPDAGRNLIFTTLLSLGKMKARESLPLLTKALSDADGMIRMKAVQALGALQTEDALRLLADHLTREQDYMVRASAVRAVGQSRSATAEGILIHSLSSDAAPLVRNNAAMMLANFESLRPESQTAIKAAWDDESPEVRKTARGIRP